ncbi:HEAT repeat domain-containing protein [Hyalangium rubrum]|uniref:HEAT repeat domain-containing protein n=1 Tax=Hyalangium rubrum TaxID=3103134 RepID=A0ABU5H7L6_9BACT|nr:HEAT repeat domain-containing protein [Hyalangium sp. s54d21]MDY7228070.1 HEAT repeat domain-containing protein [Hyalangium sp. s54d21]
MKPALLLTACVLLLGACRSQAPRYPVEEVRLSGATLTDNSQLGMAPEQVRELFSTTLKDSKRFELLGEEKPREVRPWRVTLELPFTREVLKDDGPHTYAEVGATLVLERFGGDLPERYEVVGLGEVRVEADTPEARRTALHSSLEAALRQVSESAALQLATLDRDNAGLLQDLQSSDPRLREFALRTLAERGHPAAAPLLIEQLKSSDADTVRRAIGALVEMKAASAVPALIDLSRGKEVGFLQEIVFALGEIGGTEAEAYLYTVAQGHDQPAIQAAAQQALDTLYASRKHASPEARATKPADQ